MNKLLKLVLIPLTLTFAEGCIPFHNAIRSVRHSIERATKKKTPEREPLATGFACVIGSNERASMSKAEANLAEKLEAIRKKLEKTAVWVGQLEIKRTPEPSKDIWSVGYGDWPNYKENQSGMNCASVDAYLPDPKTAPQPAPEPIEVNETVPDKAAAAVQE